MVCPQPDALSSFVDGVVGDDQRLAVELHLDECDECRSTIAILARARTADRALDATATPQRSTPGVIVAGAAFTPVPASVSPGLDATVPGGDVALAETVAGPGFDGPQLRPGDRVSRYVIRGVIGKGGMGIVYAADDPDLDREVALKLLRPDFARGRPEATRRIVLEAQTMARISHNNVVAVFDVGSFGDQVFIAMERVRGTSLRAWLAAPGRAIGEIVDVFAAAGRGLVAAHAAGIVHRDFKPDNVLVGDDGRVRVTDFGLAVEAASGTESDGAAMVGTPAYMAPEQHLGANVDPRTDQFGFCVALYEALYRSRPFAGKTRDELAGAVVSGRIDAAPPGARVPRSLRDILVRGLAVTPGDRFPTMETLLRALGRDRGRRPRQVAIAAAVILLAVVVALSADWVARGRAGTITRISFGAARSQLARLIELRTDNFTTLSDLVNNRDVFDEVVGHHDQSDFGLGPATSDRDSLTELHDSLRSADWVEFVGGADQFGIADAKGRLLYASVDAAAFGPDVLAVDAIADAYSLTPAVSLGVVRGDDPAVIAAGVLGPGRPGLYMLFARTRAVAGQPRAVFVQLVRGERLLEGVSLGQGIALSLVTADGTAEGKVPASILARGRSAGLDTIADAELDGDSWLVERYQLVSPSTHAPIADIVLARETDAGLAGLFPHARGALGGAAVILAGLVLAASMLARQRDLGRRTPRGRAAPSPATVSSRG